MEGLLTIQMAVTKVVIEFFVGYATDHKGYRIYYLQTRQVLESVHITFYELSEQMASVHVSSGPALNL